MAITDVATLDALAIMAEQTYDEPTTGPLGVDVDGASGAYVEIIQSMNQDPLGFQARAYFNTTREELVIAFAGTEGFRPNDVDPTEFVPDLLQNLALVAAGASPQQAAAQAFIEAAKLQVIADYGPFQNYDIIYTGHSMGGFLAQTASAGGTEGEVVVFNSPGVGGFLNFDLADAFPTDNYTYVYSENWGAFGPIHSTGDPLSENLFKVPGSIGHRLEDPAGTGLGDKLDDSTMLQSVTDSIFQPTDEAISAAVALAGTALTAEAAEALVDELLDAFGFGTTPIDGTSGDETLTGGDENYYITGGAGDDTLTGGDGVDTFYFYDGDGDDTITDFDIDNDRIKINGDFVNPLSQPSGVNVFESGSDVHVTYTGGTVIQTGVDFAAWAAVAPFHTPEAGGSATGDAGDNIMIGDDGVDVLYGLAGDDKIYAGPDGDFLYGGHRRRQAVELRGQLCD